MHAFVDDALVVYDPFGLTRITLSTGKVKHNKKVVGRYMISNGPLLVGHSKIANNRFAMTVPEMKVINIGESWNYNLTYGQSLGVTADGLPFEISEGGGLQLYGINGKEQSKVTMPAKKKLGVLELGPVQPTDPDQLSWSTTIATGDDGTFVVFGDRELFGGKLSGGKKPSITEAWSMDVGRVQGRIHLRAGAFGAFVSVFHPAQGKAYCVWIRAGDVTTDTVATLSDADFDGTRIVYQASATEVHRKRFGGSAIERIGLPESAQGIGTVMAHGDRLFFVTSDHEHIRDLVNDEVHERGLPDEEKPNRTKVLAFVEKFRGAANAANMTLTVEALRPPAYGQGPRPDWHWDEGDQGLLRFALVGNLLAQSYDDQDLSAGSYSPPQNCTHVTEAMVDQFLEAAETHALDLLAGVAMLDSPLESTWNPGRRSDDEAVKPLFDKPAAAKLLWAVIETVNGKPRKGLPKQLTPQLVIDSIDPSTEGWRRGHHTDTQKSAAYLLLEVFGGDALPVLLDWLLERPSGMVEANMHIMGDVAEALVPAFPKTAPALKKAIDAALAGKDQSKIDRAQSLQSALPAE